MKKNGSLIRLYLYTLFSILLIFSLLVTSLPRMTTVQAQAEPPAEAAAGVLPVLDRVVTAANIGRDNAILQGNLISLGSALEVQINFEYGSDTGYGMATTAQTLNQPGTCAVMVSGLTPGTTYHFRARAISPAGEVFSENAALTTQSENGEASPPGLTPPPIVTPPEALPPRSVEKAQVTAQVIPDQDTTIKSPSGHVKLVIPKGTLSQLTDIEMVEYGPQSSSGMQILSLFELNATESASKAKVSQFNQALPITIELDPATLDGLDVDSLRMYYLEETTREWVPLPSQYDKVKNELRATTDHFSVFGAQANPIISGPGRVMASQVNLHSGAATFSYPIELPPGPGGFQPKLELIYNSASVDEMKNKRDVGSWVGLGWTLNLGRISYDLTSHRYYLELNGSSSELISDDDANYYTIPDQHLKITRSVNTWNVYDKEGYFYRFGGDNNHNSEQFIKGTDSVGTSGTFYRWDLSLLEDTHGNTASVIYARDLQGTTPYIRIRSAYPATLTYGRIQVIFSAYYDSNQGTDGGVRNDNPISYGTNAAPAIMETRSLSSILVKSDGTDIRKYNFGYSTTPRVFEATQYGGIYYAGALKLTSISQVGADLSSTLPSTTFTYGNEQTYLNDSITVQYDGNPGNEAIFSWPHLATINNGYGASISFDYTETPGNSPSDIWTREVVTTKTINPGIGASQTTTYSYTGNPQYLINSGNVWEAKYRGFSEVRETDAAGNYVRHYYNTTDSSDGDAEKLTGLETRTEWYSSSGAPLKTVANTWVWEDTSSGYDFVRKWGNWAPSGWFSEAYGIAVDSTGNVYVADAHNHRIQKFSSSGTFIKEWGTLGTEDGEFNCPLGITIDNNNYVYVADTDNSRIQKFTSEGVWIDTWGSYGSGNGQFNYPAGLSAGSDGYIYVADRYNHRIQRCISDSGICNTSWGSYGSGNLQFNAPTGIVKAGSSLYVVDTGNNRIQRISTSGTYLSQWGTLGTGNGQFNEPVSVATYSTYIYVVDNNNNRVQKFDTAGNFLLTWGSVGNGDSQFSSPWGVAVNGTGVYVMDCYNYRVKKFDSSGNFLSKWGNYGTGGNGQYFRPLDVVTDSSGYVYLFDRLDMKIRKFTSTGTQVAYWGNVGTGDGQFNYFPHGIALSSDGYIYVADTANNRIQKFTTGGTFVAKWGVAGTGDGQFNAPDGIAVDPDGYVYVADTGNNRIQKFSNLGTFNRKWGTSGTGNGQFSAPQGVSVDSNFNVYVIDTQNARVQKFDRYGTYITKWGTYGDGASQFNDPAGITVDSQGDVYVADTDNNRIQKFTSNGTFITKWGTFGNGDSCFFKPVGVAVGSDGYVYVADDQNYRIQKFQRAYAITLDEVLTTTGSKVTSTSYDYDSYGNIITEFQDGDTALGEEDDDFTIWRTYYPNTDNYVVSKPARERVYATHMTQDSGATNLKKETIYYYDGSLVSTNSPTLGDLTRLEQKKDTSNSVITNYTYDQYGNKLTEQDPNGNTTSKTYDTLHHTYPISITYPMANLNESYTWDYGTNNILTLTDMNGLVTTYQYDTFKRLTHVIKPGDASAGYPSIKYDYLNWGTINSQNMETRTYIDNDTYLWKRDYFDGLGRVVQTQAKGESGYTIITGTSVYNNCGQIERQYVSQNINANLSAYYTTDIANWKYTAYTYDGLGRVTTLTNPDLTTISTDYTTPWQTLVTNPRGYKTRSYFDAFQRLYRVEELNASHTVYATTNYSYDTTGNLTGVTDNASNNTTMTYDWLGRKQSLNDPDMGQWYYYYDANGNLRAQVDAKSQAVNLYYDALNRLKGKTYTTGVANPANYVPPDDPGSYTVGFSYDSVAGGNYGKGLRTSMSDALGTNSASFKYDNRGRLIQETKTIDSVVYTTSYSYDKANRPVNITYPTNEIVSQTYDGRGLPYSLYGTSAGRVVNTTLYNALGSITEINQGNPIVLKTTYGYYGTGGTYDNSGGYYGKLWEIKTTKQPGGTPILQDIKYSWDANGNLDLRENYNPSTSTWENEDFSYDFLDRLTGVTGAYSETYVYNPIGNLTSKNGVSLTYDSSPHKHAVTAYNGTSYAYDSNGNMTTRGSQTLTWDVENQLMTVSGGTTFVYDGDGQRVKKTEGATTTIYVNQYYEKTGTEVTTSYYHGGRLVAQRKGTALSYLQQDSLNSNSLSTDSSGNNATRVTYYSYGLIRTSGTLITDKLFTGQRKVSSNPADGLYYYGARYYDANIGRFISPDTIVQSPANPQTLNRYTYCVNNPLKYIDPSGHVNVGIWDGGISDGTPPVVPPIQTRGIAFGYEDTIIGYDIFKTTPEQVVPGIFMGDLLVSGNKGIVTANGTFVSISNEQLNKLIELGYTIEEIALMADQQPSPAIKITGTYEINSGNIGMVSFAGFGSYVITFRSGNIYVGKGDLSRMAASALRLEGVTSSDIPVLYQWTPAASNRQSFIDEYRKMRVLGFKGPGTPGFYNKIWSPGRAYYNIDFYNNYFR